MARRPKRRVGALAFERFGQGRRQLVAADVEGAQGDRAGLPCRAPARHRPGTARPRRADPRGSCRGIRCAPGPAPARPPASAWSSSRGSSRLAWSVDLDAVAGDRRQASQTLPNALPLARQCRAALLDSAPSVAGDGIEHDLAGDAVDHHHIARHGAASTARPRPAPPAGSSARAMIAVWPSAPPSTVAKPRDAARVHQRGVGGRQLLGQDDRCLPPAS